MADLFKQLQMLAAPVAPFVHMNGTSKKELLAQLSDAIEALQNAEEALNKAAPNGRDYYNHPNGVTIQQATKEHRNRAIALRNIINELYEIAEQVDAA